MHIFKNFYNNFQNYKIFHYPDFPVNPAGYVFKARFSDIESLYDIEIQKAEKMAYKLNKKMLNPNSIEKASVQLATACFHESTFYRLLYYSLNGYPHFKETAKFLQIIRDWFNVVNVKSQYYGQKSRDNRRNAIHFNDREQLDFLRDFHSWLKTWSISRGNCLSGPTFHAAKVTTANLIHVANYLLDKKNIEYVLFGAIQSDYLEGRFGWYRQLCGGNYFNSVLQFLQAEKNICIRSLVKMGFLISEIKDIFKDTCDGQEHDIELSSNTILEDMSNFNFESKLMISSSDEAIIFYTAGAIVRSLLRNNKFEACTGMLSHNKETIIIGDNEENIVPEEQQYISLINRGGLIKPSDIVYVSCMHAWSLYTFIMNDERLSQALLSAKNSRAIFVRVLLQEMEQSSSTNQLLHEKCVSGCLFKDKLKRIVLATFNIKATNFITEANDKIHSNKKRNNDNYKRPSTAKKVKKLSSN